MENSVPIRLMEFGRVKYTREELSQLIRKLYDMNLNAWIYGAGFPSTRATYRFSR